VWDGLPDGEEQPRVSVAIVEDHPLYRRALEAIVNHHPRLRLLASVGTAREALACLPEAPPDVVLLDLMLPDGDGFSVLSSMASSDVRVVVLSGDERPRTIYQALEQGAAGYMIKDAEGDAICAAILAADRGETILSRRLQTAVAHEIRSQAISADDPMLRPREIEILRLAAQGRSTAVIATDLAVSPSTVKSHFANIYKTLGVSDRAAAVLEAVRHGLVPLQEAARDGEESSFYSRGSTVP
jgi:two-component system nitrate/nitrite response regulator NarL